MNYNQELILTQGQHSSYLYKLTQGKAEYLDINQRSVVTLTAPTYLNSVEHIYDSPMIKTIRAVGRARVVKLRDRDTQPNCIAQLKDRGIRKNKFSIFRDVPITHFYELATFGTHLHLRGSQSLCTKEDHVYLVVSGGLTVSGNDLALKLLKL